MANRTLPFYESFFEVFENHNIEKWEAKKFVELILKLSPKNQKSRQQVYNGINILVECRYLKKIANPKKKNSYLYSELERLTAYRNAKKLSKIENVMNEKITTLSKDINLKSREIEFIHQIKGDHPDIANELEEIEITHVKDLNDLLTQKSIIDKIMKHFRLD